MGNSENTKTYEALENYLYAIQQRNLVYNYNFIYFSNQIHNGDVTSFGIPDGWQYIDTGSNGSIDFNASSNQCVVKKSEGSSLMKFSQALHEFPRWEQMLLGETVSAKIILNISIAGNVKFILSDGIDSSTITKNGIGDFEIDLQLKINPDATSVTIQIESDVPYITLSISKIYANVGLMAIQYLSCVVQGVIGERKQYIATETPPAEELSLCNQAIELSNNYTRLNSVLQQRFGVGDNGNSMLLDMRGYFSRAWDNGAATDPDANSRTAPGTGTVTGDHVSTFEQDIFLKHDHGLDFSIDKPILAGDKVSATIINTLSTSSTNMEADGKETRPKNIAELYTIKWA
jgi:hypothetical protein